MGRSYSTFFLALLLLTIPQFIQAQESIVFAYDPDAVPVSLTIFDSRKKQVNSPGGFCGELYKHLASIYKTSFVPMAYNERLMRFADSGGLPANSYGVECSSITITEERRAELKEIGGYFSNAFYSSETALIIKAGNTDAIDNPDMQKSLKLVVLDSNQRVNAPASMGNVLTTLSVKDVFFPNTKSFNRRLGSRSEVYDCLIKETCDAYISDEVLLKDLLYWKETPDSPTLASEGYVIHKKSYSAEPYGVVIYDKENADDGGGGRTALLAGINQWIASEDGRRAVREQIDGVITTQQERNQSLYEKYRDRLPTMATGAFLFFLISLTYKNRHYFRKLWPVAKNEKLVTIVLPKEMSKDEFLEWMKELNEHTVVPEPIEANEHEERIRIKPAVGDFVKNAGSEAGKKVGAAVGDVVVSFIKGGGKG